MLQSSSFFPSVQHEQPEDHVVRSSLATCSSVVVGWIVRSTKRPASIGRGHPKRSDASERRRVRRHRSRTTLFCCSVVSASGAAGRQPVMGSLVEQRRAAHSRKRRQIEMQQHPFFFPAANDHDGTERARRRAVTRCAGPQAADVSR
jgi:hypothetical protein